ncbi:hypothetical protein [Tychonema sp. BBK16]|nr:hypothetical protein [Tychonema sp. BBK16]
MYDYILVRWLKLRYCFAAGFGCTDSSTAEKLGSDDERQLC